MEKSQSVWVFVGSEGRFPGGVFRTRGAAEEWIQRHGLSGVLTEYPLDVGAYDWAIAEGHFTPKTDRERSASFVGQFSSGGQDHSHYADGVRE